MAATLCRLNRKSPVAEKKSQKREYAKRQKRIKAIREKEIRQQEKDMSIAERWKAHAKAVVEQLETADETEIEEQRFREGMLQHDISRHVDGRASRLEVDEVSNYDVACGLVERRASEDDCLNRADAYADIGAVFWPDLDSESAEKRLRRRMRNLKEAIDAGNGLRRSTYLAAKYGGPAIIAGKMQGFIPWGDAQEAAIEYLNSLFTYSYFRKIE
jgi:hypothetical protein